MRWLAVPLSIAISAIVLLPNVVASAPSAPAYVLAWDADDTALIQWTPAPGAAKYRVYGLDPSASPVVLVETENLSAVVDGTYTSYAVSSISASNAESPKTSALNGGCISFTLTPPPPSYYIDPGCEVTGRIEILVPSSFSPPP